DLVHESLGYGQFLLLVRLLLARLGVEDVDAADRAFSHLLGVTVTTAHPLDQRGDRRQFRHQDFRVQVQRHLAYLSRCPQDALRRSALLHCFLEGLDQLAVPFLAIAEPESAVIAISLDGSGANVSVVTKRLDRRLAITYPIGDPEDSLGRPARLSQDSP